VVAVPVPPLIVNPVTVAVTPGSTVRTVPNFFPFSTVPRTPAPLSVRFLVTTVRSDGAAAA